MVIWKDVPIIVQDRYGDKYYGDVPVCRINTITNKLEAVVNNRGLAYATRNRLRFRKPPRKG